MLAESRRLDASHYAEARRELLTDWVFYELGKQKVLFIPAT
jgi:hypothetical protein